MPGTMNIPEHLSDLSKIWIFPAARPLSSDEKNAVEDRLQTFFSKWASHGAPVPAAGAVLDEQFVVVAVDDSLAPSGCSIDSLFREVKVIERDFQIPLLDASRVFARRDDRILALTRQEFRREAGEGRIESSTEVYDTTAETLGEIRSGRWRRPAEQSWHKEMF